MSSLGMMTPLPMPQNAQKRVELEAKGCQRTNTGYLCPSLAAEQLYETQMQVPNVAPQLLQQPDPLLQRGPLTPAAEVVVDPSEILVTEDTLDPADESLIDRAMVWMQQNPLLTLGLVGGAAALVFYVRPAQQNP